MSSRVHEIDGSGPPLVIDVSWAPEVASAHVVVLPLDASGRLLEDHLVLPRRPESSDGAIVLRPLQDERENGGMRAQLQLDLEVLAPKVHRLEIVLASLLPNATLQPIVRVVTQVWDPSRGSEHLAVQSPPPGLGKCYILVALDRGEDSWQCRVAEQVVDVDITALANARLAGVTNIY